MSFDRHGSFLDINGSLDLEILIGSFLRLVPFVLTKAVSLWVVPLGLRKPFYQEKLTWEICLLLPLCSSQAPGLGLRPEWQPCKCCWSSSWREASPGDGALGLQSRPRGDYGLTGRKQGWGSGGYLS